MIKCSFVKVYDKQPVFCGRAPGRVNLIGIYVLSLLIIYLQINVQWGICCAFLITFQFLAKFKYLGHVIDNKLCDCLDHIVCVFMTLLCGVILVVVYIRNSVCVTITVWRHSSDIENMIVSLTCCWCWGCRVVIRSVITPRLFLILAYLPLAIALFVIVCFY